LNCTSSTLLKTPSLAQPAHFSRPLFNPFNLLRRYKKQLIFLAIIILTGVYHAGAQTAAPDPILNQQKVSLNLGSQGIGGEYAYGIHKQIALRLGINVIPVSVNDAFKISNFNSTSKVSAKFTNVHLLADYTPFKSASAFRLVGGAAYFTQARGTLKVQPSDNYTYGDIVLNEEQVGYLNMDIDWKGIAPYLGIGLFKAMPKNRFNVNVDLGTYYLKKPDVQINGTGILKGNDTQEPQLQENVKNYRWMPVLQLNFNYKL
jgi:hypothetical protein